MIGALVTLGLMWAPGAAAERVEFTVAASGDLLVHEPVAARALANGGGRRYDFRPMFRSVRARIAGADLALCHMETPLVPGPVRGYPSFRTPPARTSAARPRITPSMPGSSASTRPSGHSTERSSATPAQRGQRGKRDDR